MRVESSTTLSVPAVPLMKAQWYVNKRPTSTYAYHESHILKAASPSIESFSTLQDQEEVADLQEDGRDLQIRVDNPQKHLSTLETYITFRITSKVGSIIPGKFCLTKNLIYFYF